MKKIIFLIVAFFIGFNCCRAEEKIQVSLESCVDGDTANFVLNNEVIKVRMLAIDTPETKHPTIKEEPFGLLSSEFTCNELKNANKIEIEYDSNSGKLDKYNRHLAWVWVDGYLLQDKIIKEGLAEVAYLYGDYKYTGTLENHQAIAKSEKVGIWSEKKIDQPNYFILGIIMGGTVILVFTGHLTKYKIKKIKKQLKKYGG